MTQDQLDIEDVNFILGEVRRIAAMSPAEERKHIEDNPNASDFLYSLRDEKTRAEYIYGREASRRLSKLADRHLDRQPELRDNIDPRRFKEQLASFLVARFLTAGREVDKSEVQSFLSAALKRVKAEQKSLIHYIPCVVFDVSSDNEHLTFKEEEAKYRQFWIGPVLFCRTSDFLRKHKRTIKDDLSNDCGADAEHVSFMMKSLVKFFKGYRWVGVVTIPQCNEKISRLRAETAVQGALDILKLAFGPGQTARIRLAESLTPPRDIAQVRRASAGPFCLTVSRTWADGIGISEGAFYQIAESKDFFLEAAGSALNACIDPRKEIHLSRRFLDALTWYGQAVTERMPSAKIVKYVAAWERLAITQKEEIGLTEKVTRRITILSYVKEKGDLSTTLKEVKTIYDWRSRLMHGSCSPFDKQLMAVSSLAGNLTTTALNRSLDVFVPLAHRIKNAKECDLEAEYERLERIILPKPKQ
jgi:hypothetical protein